jgi:DNA-binding response OmpR family regulator
MDQDKELAEAICATLRAGGHDAVQADAEVELEQLGHGSTDLLVLDVTPSTGTATTVIQLAKQATPAIPVLLLGARSQEDEILAALAAGADDYLIKPVRHGEIATRVQVLLKRTYPGQHAGELVHFAAYTFDTASARMTRDGKSINVTQKEFDLALLFFRHLDRPLSRTTIREAIWPGESELPSRTLDTHVSRVRNKLGLRPENGFRLSPVYSYGYQLERLSR